MLQWEVDKILWAYCTPATTITYLWAFLNGQHLKLKCKWKGRKHSYKQLFLPNIVIQPLLQKSKQHHFNQGMHKNQVKFTQKPWMQKQATERHVERCNYSSGKKHRYTDRNNQSSTILNIKILDILQRSARFQNLLSHDKLSAHYSLDSATNTIQVLKFWTTNTVTDNKRGKLQQQTWNISTDYNDKATRCQTS
jgi:hypothetical protein